MPTEPPTERELTRRREVGNAIRHAREHAGLTQERVGDMAGLDGKTVHRVESAKHDPAFSTLIRIADAIGVPLSDLVRE